MRSVLLGMLLFLTAAPPAAAPVVVRVTMTEFAFRPAVIRLAAGRPATLLLVNRGQLAHQLEADYFRRTPTVILHDGLRVETGRLDLVRLQPGSAATIEFYPRTPGRFSFACTIEGHKEAGMVGSFEVR